LPKVQRRPEGNPVGDLEGHGGGDGAESPILLKGKVQKVVQGAAIFRYVGTIQVKVERPREVVLVLLIQRNADVAAQHELRQRKGRAHVIEIQIVRVVAALEFLMVVRLEPLEHTVISAHHR